jgi:hypothetical protein
MTQYFRFKKINKPPNKKKTIEKNKRQKSKNIDCIKCRFKSHAIVDKRKTNAKFYCKHIGFFDKFKTTCKHFEALEYLKS